MVNEILAKLNQNEKIIGGGAIAILVGWILGLILTSSGGFSWYGQSGAQGTGLLAILARPAGEHKGYGGNGTAHGQMRGNPYYTGIPEPAQQRYQVYG